MSTFRVLVVDDEPLVLKSVQFALARSGYVIEVSSSGQQALERIESECFDLVLTDWRMPLMNGEQLARSIRTLHPDLPIVLLTGSIMDTPPSGFDGVLFKPFSVRDLRAAVQSLAQQSKELLPS